MRCEQCGKAEAVVKITRLESGAAPYQICLCQTCAADASPYQKKILEKQSTYDFLLQKLLKQQQESRDESEAAASTGGGTGAQAAQEETPMTCPSCGLDYARYRATLMLGCPDCYEAFAELLERDLFRFHRATRHGVEAESRPTELADLQDRLRDAKSELKSALELEDYERAAFLRDEVGGIERRLAELRAGKA